MTAAGASVAFATGATRLLVDAFCLDSAAQLEHVLPTPGWCVCTTASTRKLAEHAQSMLQLCQLRSRNLLPVGWKQVEQSCAIVDCC